MSEKEDKTQKKEEAPKEAKKKDTPNLLSKEVNVGKLLNELVENALAQKASDIHIEPREDKTVIRYRVDGILQDIREIDKEIESALVFKIKVASKLRTDEHFAPQDGRIKFELDDHSLNTRISVLPTSKGEKVVMRLLNGQGEGLSLETLGLNELDLEKVKANYIKPYGLIIASGPTGSGKTTTLYSILKILNSREVNITTIEDPVEYEVEGVNQVHVNTKANLTFASGLRSLLRQDPDIIMIGEIRDSETARIAINAAMTGHLVLSTIHTNDAITTVPRFIDMGVEPYLVASTMNLVIAQRLARKLCEKCKTKTKVTKEYLTNISKYRKDIAAMLKVGEEIHEKGECPECSKGYKGRIGLYEVLSLSKELRAYVGTKTTADELFDVARKDPNFKLILEDGIEKVRAGIIDIPELIRITAVHD